MVHRTKPLNFRWCLRRGPFLSPNKKGPKEVGLGGGAECRTPDAKAIHYGILATGKYWYYGFAARSTTLPLRTLSRRAFCGVLSFFSLAFWVWFLSPVSCISYLISRLHQPFRFTFYYSSCGTDRTKSQSSYCQTTIFPYNEKSRSHPAGRLLVFDGVIQ